MKLDWRKIYMNSKEESIMNIVWDYNKPITSVELLKLIGNEIGGTTAVYRVINSLLEKKILQVCGTARYKTQYARQFEAVISREEYMAHMVLGNYKHKNNKNNKNNKNIAKVAMALVEEAVADEVDDELIQQLEDIIAELKELKR